MSSSVRVVVLSAVRDLGGGVVATVTLDDAVTVTGVRLAESLWTGRITAEPPRRLSGAPIISWSPAVADAVAAAVTAALPTETVAVIDDDAPEAEVDDVCPACGGRWVTCGCSMEDADAAYEPAEAA